MYFCDADGEVFTGQLIVKFLVSSNVPIVPASWLGLGRRDGPLR